MLVITSSDRAYNQVTWSNLPPEVRRDVEYIVPKAQAAKYRRALGKDVPIHGIDANRLNPKRQFAIDELGKRDNVIILLDDDLCFAHRRKDDPSKFQTATKEQITQAFGDLHALLGDYAHASIAARQGANRITDPMRYVGRVLRVLGFNVPLFKEAGATFENLEVMADFDVTLALLRAGYPNAIINNMVQDHKGSNTAGGCSKYRTAEMKEQAVKNLIALHEPFVKPRMKKTKWKGMDKEHMDVTIFWKKAYLSSGGVMPL